MIADASANPDWVAMDLFSQAEHDELAQAILVTPDAALLDAVAASAQRQIADMPRRAIIAASFAQPRRARSRCATSTRPARSRTASRPSISSSPSPIPPRCCRRSATPARSSWGTMRRRRWATTAPARTTCCRPAAPRAFRRRSASTISRSARRVLDISPAAARALGPVAATLARRRGTACARAERRAPIERWTTWARRRAMNRPTRHVESVGPGTA